MNNQKEKNVNSQIYFDCICGAISSILSLIGIAYSVIVNGIENHTFFTIGLTFWLGYLIFSIFLIFLGIYTWYKEKKFDKIKQRKDLRPPIVS